MRQSLILAVTLALPFHCAGQELETLLAGSSPEIQQQIEKTYAAFNQIGVDPTSNADVFREAQAINELTNDKSELVRQLAIFVATTESEEGSHVILSLVILRYLDASPENIVQVLAPCLESDNPRLHEFARRWFKSYDKADPGEWAAANYKEYLDYVRWSVSRGEAIPTPFVKYIYERSPGRALKVFRIATVDVSDYMQVLRKSVEAAQQGRAPTEQEREEIRHIQAERQREGQERREILLAEHIVSNAIWLHKNKFDERFQAALPEAMTELEKLAKNDQWWARMYVVYIMRQNPALLKDKVLRQLAEDSNELVSKAAKSADEKSADE